MFHAKKEVNLGTLMRSAFNFGAAYVFTVGRRYSEQASDTVRAVRHGGDAAGAGRHFVNLNSVALTGGTASC